MLLYRQGPSPFLKQIFRKDLPACSPAWPAAVTQLLPLGCVASVVLDAARTRFRASRCIIKAFSRRTSADSLWAGATERLDEGSGPQSNLSTEPQDLKPLTSYED